MTEKTEKITITYCGMRMETRSKSHHSYMDQDGESLTFKKKLQRHHRVGYTYPAERTGKSYATSGSDGYVDVEKDADLLARWIKDNEDAIRIRQAQNDLRKLRATVREAVKPLRRIYQRADPFNRAEIIRTIITELTGIR